MSEEREARKKATRREFVKGAAVGAAATGAGILAGCAAPQSEAGPQGPAGPAGPAGPKGEPGPLITAAGVAYPLKYECDVVVAGSGNGGLSAATAAAKEGASVVLVEVSSTTGGGSAMCSGSQGIASLALMMAPENTPAYDAYVQFTEGLSDPALAKVFLEKGAEYLAWVAGIGADGTLVSPMNFLMGTPPPGGWPGGTFGARPYFDSLERIFNDAGGTLLLKTRAKILLTDEQGRVAGLRVEDSEGIYDIKAKAVILCVGGFQGNPELRRKYYGPQADLATVIGTPYNVGDGLVMAQEVGASLSAAMGYFAAGMWPVQFPAFVTPNPMESPQDFESRPYTIDGKYEYEDIMQYLGPPGYVAVNLDGKRFVDENDKWYRLYQAMIKQPRATAMMVFDDWMWQQYGPAQDIRTGTTMEEQFAIREKYGGKLLQASTIEDLADQLANLGPPVNVHRANFLETMSEYNAAVAAGTAADLDVPKTGIGFLAGTAALKPIEQPPFYAWPVIPGIYMCFGGLAINEKAQVLDQAKRPITGLYASFPTAGGIFREVYPATCVGLAGTFGWIAGNDAAAYAKTVT